MDEFQEIAHTGGKIEFVYDEQQQGVGIRISSANPWACTMVQICVSYEGKILDFVPSGGIGAVIPYPQPSIMAFLLSDQEGLFGQKCPTCKSYFRSDAISGNTTCPYCGCLEHGVAYLTESQTKFLKYFCDSYITAHNEKRSVAVDIDSILSNLEVNSPEWLYTEERQQTKKVCQCRCTYDILGDYGVCPACARPNFQEVINEKFDQFESQFNFIDSEIEDRVDREIEWEKLTRCVSEFEALANNIRIHLAHLPMTPRRRSGLESLSFQRILHAADVLRNWFDINIFEEISTDDQEFLNNMFNRRHVFTHNAGRIDQEYIDNTKDKSVRVNQTIRFRSREIRRLIPLVRQCSIHMIKGFESIE